MCTNVADRCRKFNPPKQENSLSLSPAIKSLQHTGLANPQLISYVIIHPFRTKHDNFPDPALMTQIPLRFPIANPFPYLSQESRDSQKRGCHSSLEMRSIHTLWPHGIFTTYPNSFGNCVCWVLQMVPESLTQIGTHIVFPCLLEPIGEYTPLLIHQTTPASFSVSCFVLNSPPWRRRAASLAQPSPVHPEERSGGSGMVETGIITLWLFNIAMA